jgi:hypothetical protein
MILVVPNTAQSWPTYGPIIVILNLKFQPDKFKNSEEKAIIVFHSFGFSYTHRYQMFVKV